MDSAVWQSVIAVGARDLVREHGADRTVAVADRHVDRHLLPALERGLSKLDQPVVQRLFQAVVLALAVVARDFRRHVGHPEDLREVQTLRLPMLDALLLIEQIASADKIAELPRSEERRVGK